jgi:hypothetical protein
LNKSGMRRIKQFITNKTQHPINAYNQNKMLNTSLLKKQSAPKTTSPMPLSSKNCIKFT